jgi:exportin-T
LSFYQRLLSQNVTSFRTAAAGIIRTLIAKGQKDPADKLQVLNVLDIISLLDPLEASTRGGTDETIGFRVALGSILAAYGTELVELWENDENPETIRREAESRIDAARPLLLRFMADAHHEVPHATNPFVSDLLRVVSFSPYLTLC